MSILKLFTAPAVEPVTIDEVMSHLRITEDDPVISSYIKAARMRIEALCGPIIQQTWKQYNDAWPAGAVFSIGKPRLISVTSITYTDSDGVSSTISSSDYTVSTYDDFAPSVVLKDTASWPSAELFSANPICTTFMCGFGATPSTVPEDLRFAIMALVGNLYENREGSVDPGFIVDSISSYRVWGA